MLKSKPILERLYVYSLFLFVFALPFQVKFIPIFLGVIFMGIFGLILLFTSKEKKTIKGKTPVLLVAGLYVLALIGMLYTTNMKMGGRSLEVKLTLFLFPIIMAFVGPFDKKLINKLLSFFAHTVAISAIVCFIGAFQMYLDDGKWCHFFYSDLVIYKLIPPHYFGMYVSFAFFIHLTTLVKEFGTLKKQYRNLLIFELALFVVFIALLSARAQWLAFALTFGAVALFFFKQRGQLKRGLLYLVAIFAVLFALVLTMPQSRKRFFETVDELKSVKGVVNKKQTNHRVFIWSYGSEVVQENWLIGTGTGCGVDALHEKLLTCDAVFWRAHTPYKLSEFRYNYHNAFLQHAATHGIVGLIVLFGLFVLSFIRSIKTSDYLLMAFTMLVFISFFTESMLERQAGVLFFAFFYPLLMLRENQKDVN